MGTPAVSATAVGVGGIDVLAADAWVGFVFIAVFALIFGLLFYLMVKGA